MAQEKILIITQEIDPHADLMVAELRRREVECIRWHPETFPLKSGLKLRLGDEGMEGSIRIDGGAIDMKEIRSVWYRRPAPFLMPPGLSAEEEEFARDEARSAFHGLLRGADWFWVNHPDRVRIASAKVLQLKTAREVGLAVPRTLITNDPREVGAFFDACSGRIVYKTFNSPFFGRSEKACLTTPLSREHLDRIDLIRNAPGIFQEYVLKKLELRVTVIGSAVFTAAIHSQEHPQAKHDWRGAEVDEIRHSPHELPGDVEAKCLALLDHFGLAFGAIDMILTPEGRYIFLENNPGGQFGWIEELTGLPLTATLADLLIAGRMI